jgi:hypothetical protein
MSIITRTWLAFAAIGAGLIHFALSVGMPWAVAIPLTLIGAAEFGWGVIVFARTTVIVPRIALVGALVPIVLWAALLVTSSVPAGLGLGLLPLAIAAVLGLVVAVLLARHLRREADAPAPAPPGIVRYLVGVVAGGLVVAALTAPALAATSVGRDGPSPTTVSNLRDLFGHGH